MNLPPNLSIVVVSWNTAGSLQDCLSKLENSTARDQIEIIVVDNASTDDSPALVKRDFPAVSLIENTQNVGFARANNQGLALSRGRCVLLLNSDALVPPSALTALLAFMEAHPEAGACGPRLLQRDETPQPFAFGGDPTPAYLLQRALTHLLLRRPLHAWDTDRVQAVDWVSGACLMARREAVEQAGPLDEAIFMYFEDNDWCLRFRQCGWKIYYNPEVAITHLGGQSLKQNPEARKAYYASLEYFYRKHYGPLSRLWLRVCLPFYRLMVRY